MAGRFARENPGMDTIVSPLNRWFSLLRLSGLLLGSALFAVWSAAHAQYWAAAAGLVLVTAAAAVLFVAWRLFR